MTGNFDAQEYGEPPSSGALNSEEDAKQIIFNVEDLLDFGDQEQFTEEAISGFIDEINKVVRWGKSHRFASANKSAILGRLRKAREELYRARNNVGKNSVYTYIGKARSELEEVLNAWKTKPS